MATTSSSMMEDVVQTWPSIEMLCKGHSMKQHFPKFWSSIQRYYESRAPQKVIPKLSPHDLHLKWRLASHKCKELSSIVMNFAPSIVSVSVFSGVKRYLDCSGYIIDWDDSNKIATILTSAKVMRFPGERDDYYIVIRLANGKILLAEEDYVDYYNNIVTLKVNSDTTLKPVERDVETVEGVVVALGREFYTCKLLESSGVICKDHPYFGCELLVSSTCSGSEVLEGGPLITGMGHGCGINFFDGSKFIHPLPTSVIYSCLDKWNSSRIVMRPWFGLSVIDIAQLPHGVLENIAGVRDDSTAVVKEVYEGSPADKAGLHSGETVTALMRSQRKITIDSASEYARTLSNISGELSACYLNNTPEILISVRGYDSDICKVVHAEILRVNDKKFCCR
ncbi:hypothetical protein POM88_002140 [Heracleum sosnowskyi]|uniref:PDZ domain-containing protein n=1 Tax=Heracleum sosnowskyi TaxID=360622 RepID=A0AAD8JHY4_9APIA|nr:hypothetical protein POM88_002140 [Heracleum sosnowskyi]